MVSAGNDIVSFAEIDAIRTKQPAFYKKIIIDSELLQYKKLAGIKVAFETYIWLLWSVKEAAFKYLGRFNSELVFSPSKFIVDDIWLTKPTANTSTVFDEMAGMDTTTWQGAITVNHTDLTFISYVCALYVHSIIQQPDHSGTIYSAVKRITDSTVQSQSSQVRDLCLDKLNQLKPGERFNIIKSEQGVPSIYNLDQNLSYPVSFSHHGHFVACAFLI